MNINELVEWQKIAPNGLVYPWWVHGFLDVLETWDLKDVQWLEFGGGRSTAWLRSRCKWVDTIEANEEWAALARYECMSHDLTNGYVSSKDLPDGVQERKHEYFNLLNNPDRPVLGSKKLNYHIISVDGIWRNECLQWAIDHFKGRKGILIADNYDQDYVWISPKADEIMMPYKKSETIFYQPDHTNHEGKQWNTRFWIIE